MTYRTSVCQRIINYHSYAGIRWYTLVYAGIRWYTLVYVGIRWYTLVFASGTSGIGCKRFKHRVIRWHTSRQKIIFYHV